MPNLRLCWNNLLTASATVISSSSAISTLPAANATLPDRSLVWRSTSTTADQWVQFDLGAAAAITAVLVANPKLHSSGGTLKVQQAGSAGSPGSWADVATLPTADTDTKVTFAFVGSTSARWWRLYFTNVGVVTDYVEVGYAFLGTYFESAQNVIAPLATPLTDNSVITKSLSGQRTTTVRPQQSSGSFQWLSMPSTDLATLQQIFRTQGQGIPTFAVLQTSITWTAWLLYFGASAGLGAALNRTFTIVDTYFDIAIDWEEAL